MVEMMTPDEHPDSDSSWDDELFHPVPPPKRQDPPEPMADRLRRVRADLEDLNKYYNITVSARRINTLLRYYTDELHDLSNIDFEALDQQGRVDYLILRNFLRLRRQQMERWRNESSRFVDIIAFAPLVISLCEERQDVLPMDAEDVAARLEGIANLTAGLHEKVEKGEIKSTKTSGYQASKVVEELRVALGEMNDFYASYDPSYDWWATTPYQAANEALVRYRLLVQTKLAGIDPNGAGDEIIGEPIGKRGLLDELAAEMIPYSPEELLDIAQEQYAWCEKQMIQASQELGYGKKWKDALEYVKTLYVPVGQQTQMVRNLAREGSAYVQKHKLVTVPPIADQTWRMFMMPPAQQRVSPFFLGGPSIQVASPTVDMEHDLKKMVLKGNNSHFSKATAFHELIPGHRLQLYMAQRHNSHRSQLVFTPFFIEGWALYWEMVFWERGDFFVSPENRIGTMFWRMHRCARIIFSLNFHLGKMSPQECVDLLVDWVGHERSTAEGEVRRSLEGSYGPLYQAAYMLGALQMWALRKEAVDERGIGEREFHDEVLKTGGIHVELVRALILGKELTRDYESSWRFS